MPKAIISLLLVISLFGCATPKPTPYFKPRIAERITKMNEKALKENWLWIDWTKKVIIEIEAGLNEWAEHNLKRR